MREDYTLIAIDDVYSDEEKAYAVPMVEDDQQDENDENGEDDLDEWVHLTADMSDMFR